MSTTITPQFEEATYKKAASRLIPFLFLCYIVAFLDRVNVGFAKLQMASDLQFSDAIYGFGAGIFFIGYFIFEVPSNVILERVGARIWIARIMITWGLISSAFMFTGDIHWGPIATFFTALTRSSRSTSCDSGSAWRRRVSSRASSSISRTGFPARGAPRWLPCS